MQRYGAERCTTNSVARRDESEADGDGRGVSFNLRRNSADWSALQHGSAPSRRPSTIIVLCISASQAKTNTMNREEHVTPTTDLQHRSYQAGPLCHWTAGHWPLAARLAVLFWVMRHRPQRPGMMTIEKQGLIREPGVMVQVKASKGAPGCETADAVSRTASGAQCTL